MALTTIDQNIQECLYIGNLDSKRDWGHAKDYVKLQWKMLQQDEPDDYVIASGRQASVRHFIGIGAIELGWGGISWEGKGVNEVGRRKDSNRLLLE